MRRDMVYGVLASEEMQRSMAPDNFHYDEPNVGVIKLKSSMKHIFGLMEFND